MVSPPLWQHQRDAIAKAGPRFALHFDPGTGKSRTAIELLRKAAIRTEGDCLVHSVFKVIIFAPLNVCRNWENEIKEYLGSPYETFIVAGGTKDKKLKELEKFARYGGHKHAFLICNIESLRSKEYREILIRTGTTFIIADEFHNFKTPTSLQTKGFLYLLDCLRPKYVYMLTGTPAPQGYIDLWTTFKVLGRTHDIFFVWRKKHFEDKNFRRRGYAGYWPDYRIREKSKLIFEDWLAEGSLTAKKDEVLDLPPMLYTNIYAEMSNEQKKHYETMREFLFAVDADGNELNASNLLSRTLRLQQILAGFLGDVAIDDNPRLAALDAAIDKCEQGGAEGDAPQQFIIWTIFRATYGQLGERLTSRGIEFATLTGDDSAEARHDAMERFQAGRLRALIAHPKAGGVGVNLTAASYSIHYTKNFSLVDDLQAEARNYRGGSERHKRITRIDIITPDTIDEEISKALREKKSVQDFILGLKAGRNP